MKKAYAKDVLEAKYRSWRNLTKESEPTKKL